MHLRHLSAMLLLTACPACAPEAVPEPRPAEAPQPALPPAPPVAEAAPAPPPAPEPPPDPAAQKKKEEAAKLAQDTATMEADAKKEAERFTPELRAEVKALAEATYPDAKKALGVVLKAKHRAPGNADRDAFRHPLETLTFFGLTPKMTVLDLEPGAGWYTELLAPVLAKSGKLLVSNTDPAGPPEVRNTFYGKRFERFMQKSPELTGKVETIVIDPDNPKLGHEGQLDMVISMREMHNWVRFGRIDKTLAEVRKALKKGGVFGVEDHRAKPDAVPEESAKKGYLPEAWVIKTVEAAGFKLAAKSEINANPKDTKDYEEGVWTLPPSY